MCGFFESPFWHTPNLDAESNRGMNACALALNSVGLFIPLKECKKCGLWHNCVAMFVSFLLSCSTWDLGMLDNSGFLGRVKHEWSVCRPIFLSMMKHAEIFQSTHNIIEPTNHVGITSSIATDCPKYGEIPQTQAST
mmetsp:Transcript_12380/g.29469  ORF Transcript_12380/g.29469 Transcript_12380/m.29469 type:complete len:137 (+) Transcript_12380:3515-3925(+)